MKNLLGIIISSGLCKKGRLSGLILITCWGWLEVAGAYAQVTNRASAPPGLVSWWRGENSTADAVGGNNGTIAGTGLVTYGAGVVGQAFVFDGTHRDRISVGNPGNLQLQDFTLEAWVKRSSPTVTSFDVLGTDGSDCGDGACIIGYGRGGYILAVANDGRLILSRTDLDGVFSAPLITDVNWHHLAVTKAGTNAVFYVDGQPQATPPYVPNGPYTFDDASCSCNAAIAIGSRGDARGGTFYGRIDEPVVFNRALSPGEVKSIYAAGTTGMGPVNNWTNPSSAKWESPSWSLGVMPASDQTVQIMNDGYKAVNIDSATLAEFPSSLTVGSLELSAPTNALSTLLLNYFGLNMPLKVLNSCVIQNNGTLLNLASSFEVDGTNGGALTIDGGTFTQEGGLTLVTAPVVVRNGSMNATNGNLTLGEVTLGTANSAGNFNQDDGSIAAQRLALQNGTYTLASGNLYAIGGTQLSINGSFNQPGGNNYGDITMDGGHYNFSGGLVQGNVLSAHGGPTQGGNFSMTGGVLDMREIDWSDQGGWYLSAYFRHGSVRCGSLNITGSAYVYVEVADVFVTNNVDLRDGATLETGFCHLRASTVTMYGTTTYNPTFWQGGGIIPAPTTNVLFSGLTMYGGQYVLQGGTLQTPYIGVGFNARMAQEGGQNLVQGTLSMSGQYEATGGSLVTEGLYLRGSMLLWGPPIGGANFTNTGLLDLGGSLGTGLTNAWGGQVRLSTNATISFIGSPAQAQLRFAASSDMSWTPGALLVITNWNNSGGLHIFFGRDASALSASQLAQIQFANPGGFPPGSYAAQLLSTGELVPLPAPVLQTSRMGDVLVITWTGSYQLLTATNVVGPYQPVSGATSPYSINMRGEPKRFFKLQ